MSRYSQTCRQKHLIYPPSRHHRIVRVSVLLGLQLVKACTVARERRRLWRGRMHSVILYLDWQASFRILPLHDGASGHQGKLRDLEVEDHPCGVQEDSDTEVACVGTAVAGTCKHYAEDHLRDDHHLLWTMDIQAVVDSNLRE